VEEAYRKLICFKLFHFYDFAGLGSTLSALPRAAGEGGSCGFWLRYRCIKSLFEFKYILCTGIEKSHLMQAMRSRKVDRIYYCHE
jgi:hypothetical protein